MARSYAPFKSTAEALLRQPHRHISRVTVEPSENMPIMPADFDLEFDECEVNMDESNTILYSVTMSGPAPTGTLRLEALSEIYVPHLVIQAGYEWADGTTEIYSIATVFLRSCDFKDGRYNLLAMSGESLSDELDIGDHMEQVAPNKPGTFTVNEWLLDVADLSTQPYTSYLRTGLPTFYQNGALNALTYEYGTTAMQCIAQVAGALGLWIHTMPSGVRASSVWVIEPRPLPAAGDDDVKLTLDRSYDGHVGVAVSINEFHSRDEFYNRVVHTWWWKNGETDFEFTADADPIPAKYQAGGVKTYYERINSGIEADSARASVRAKLSNLLSRSVAFEIQAISAYWITPGQFVKVTGATGPEAKMHVRRVSFNLATHEMTIATRLPNIPDTDISSSI